MFRVSLILSFAFFHYTEPCIKTASPDDMVPANSCTLSCTLPYTCSGIGTPGGICEALVSIGNPKVTTVDHVTCSVQFTCPTLNLGIEGYETWYQDLTGVWTSIGGSNGATVSTSCMAGTGNQWSYMGLTVLKLACAF